MNAETVAKGIALVCGIAGIWARFVTLEEARDNQQRAVTQLRLELDALDQRVLSLERDRQMLERVHVLELRLVSIEEHLKEHRR